MADSITVGNVQIGVVVDVSPPPRELSQFFPEVPPEKWEPYKAEHLGKDAKFDTTYVAWVLRSGGQTVLVDTGLGPGPHERFGGIQGQLIMGLKNMGISPGDVSVVVITHLHADHIGWNVSQVENQSKATFPKAKYVVSKGDWDHFTKPDVLQNQAPVRDNAVPLQRLGVLELVSGEHAVTPEITTLPTPGHTPGHMSVVISSQGQKAIVVGDLFHTSVQVEEPDWCAGADLDKDVARKSRRAVFDLAEREGFVVAAGHLPKGRWIGKVVRPKGRRLWQVL